MDIRLVVAAVQQPFDSSPPDGDDLEHAAHDAVRTLHLLARQLESANHVGCLHEPLGEAREELLALAVRFQAALRDLR